MEKIIKVDEPDDNYIAVCMKCDKQMLLYSSEEVFGADDKGDELSLDFIVLKCPKCDEVIWVLQKQSQIF